MRRTLTAAAAALTLCGGLSAGGGAIAQPHHRHGGGPGWHGGWRSEWRPGARIDRDYWRHGSRVDWRRHHLRRPPAGYEWRYVDGRYVMAAVATGLIASIIMNSH